MKLIYMVSVILVTLSACGGSDKSDVPDIQLNRLLSDDGTQNAIALPVGEAVTDQYGYDYGAQQLEQVQFDISTCPGIATVEVQGYDIDRSTEVQVFANEISIGYLSRGRGNNRLNSGDTFEIDNTGNQANTLTFQQTRPSEKWGVTNVLLSTCETQLTDSSSNSSNDSPDSTTGGQTADEPPEEPTTDASQPSEPSLITLSSTVNTSRYGHRYGSSENYTEAKFGFVNNANARRLLVSGYDINRSDEISVWLNSYQIGYLSRGKKRKLNDGDSFILPVSQQIDGINTVSFRQTSTGDRWGVTNLSLLSEEPDSTTPTDNDPVEPPVIPPPVDSDSESDPIILTTTLNENEYGNEYGSSTHETSVSFLFSNTGVDSYVSVYGFDVDTKKEVQVELNGDLIGHLTKGDSQAENDGDVFLLPSADQIPGENTITFRQSKNVGEPWGVTNIQMIIGCNYQVNGTLTSSGVSKVIDETDIPDNELTGTLIFANFFNGSAIENGTDQTVSVCVSDRDALGNRFAHFTTDVGQDDDTIIKAYPEFIIGSKFGLANETSFRPGPDLVSTTGFKYPILDAVADIVGLPTFTYNIPDIDIVLDIDEQNVVGSIRDVMLESWFYDTSADSVELGNHAINSTEWSPWSDVRIPIPDNQEPYFYQGESIKNTLNNIVGPGHSSSPAGDNILLEMMVHVGPLSPNDISGTSRNPARFQLTDSPITIGDYQYHIWYGINHRERPLVVYSRETNALGQPLLNLTEEGEIYLDWNEFLDYSLNSLEPQLAAAGVEWAQGEDSVFKRMRASSGAIGSLEFGIEPQTNNPDDEPYRATVRKFEVYIRGKNFGL